MPRLFSKAYIIPHFGYGVVVMLMQSDLPIVE